MSGEGFALNREIKDEKQKALRLARIEALEDEIFERAVGVVNAALSFAEISPTQTEPPEAWIAELGYEAAKQKLEIAKLGHLPQSLAPNGFKLAAQVATGIARGRGYRAKITQNNLNVKISLPPPTTVAHPGPITYETRELDP